ncbi:MAG: TrkH family potassium uptake protein [Candidatus Aminicenantes bacterium]|nr:TrkH family potassium uptake protein [Candidatus Aminicenantes bacterium]
MFRQKRFQPASVLAISFLIAITLGTIILLFPASTVTGKIRFIDALFTATSAICVTGLTVVDTATYFTRFGQIIILILIQLGGLGIMTFSTLILLAAGRRISIQDRIMVQESFLPRAPRDFRAIIRNIFFMTVAIELAGTIFLFLCLNRKFAWPEALFHSLFHAVSSFCNAGFSTFSDNLQGFVGDVVVNLTIISLIILGGLGFLVIQECFYYFVLARAAKRYRFSLHSKIVLTVSSSLIITGWLVLYLLESSHGFNHLDGKGKILASLFQAVTPRTAGFNTVDLRNLQIASIFFLMGLMFIGASPGSTGGGIKTATLGVIIAFIRAKLRARERVYLFYRTLPDDCLTRAFTLFFLALSWIALASFFIFLAQPSALMKEVFFEVFSAFGTVGLSLGLASELTPIGKIVIIVTMYIGRIGPLTILTIFSRTRPWGQYEYVEESVMIG